MILVLGATGTVGRKVVKRLLAKGVPVRAAWHTRPLAPAGTEPVKVDLRSAGDLRQALRGVDRLFLLTPDAPDQREIQLRIVNDAVQSGMERIVLLSVLGAETDSFSYAHIHRAAETTLETSGVAYTILRPNAFMQNFTSFYRQQIETTGCLRLPCGDARVSHISAHDVAVVAAEVLCTDGHEGRAYDLTGPEALSFREAMDLVARADGRRLKYETVTDETFASECRSTGVPADAVERMLDQHRFTRLGHSARVTPAVAAIAGRPPTHFEHFLRDEWPGRRWGSPGIARTGRQGA